MKVPAPLSRLGDWFFRTSALREARRELALPEGQRAQAAAQARLFMEVARRVAEPTESLPEGSRAAALVSLYRDALSWGLASQQPSLAGAVDFKALWAAADRERLSRLAGGPEALAEAERCLLNDSAQEALRTSDGEAALVRRFSEAFLWELDAPVRKIDRVQGQRVVRLTLLAALLGLAGIGVMSLPRGADLAKDKPFTTSSVNPSCDQPRKCQNLLFHTQEERNPWVRFDLGKVYAVKRVEVKNRSDCCGERAVPLVVEISLDDQTYTEVARTEVDFSEWVAKFPSQDARYVRLRALRKTLLHLDGVTIR